MPLAIFVLCVLVLMLLVFICTFEIFAISFKLLWTSIQPNSIVIVAMKLFPCYLWLFSLFLSLFQTDVVLVFPWKWKHKSVVQTFAFSWHCDDQWINAPHPTTLNSIDLIISPAIHIRHINIIRQKQLTKSRLKVTPTTCFVASVFVCIQFWDEKKNPFVLVR